MTAEVNQYQAFLKRVVKHLGMSHITNKEKLYSDLENENHHSICALINALNELKINTYRDMPLLLCRICVVLIKSDYFHNELELDESTRQDLIRLRSTISMSFLQSTVDHITKNLRRS